MTTLSDKQLVRKCVQVLYLFTFLPSSHLYMFLGVCLKTYLCCPQDSISQKSLDIQSRSDDQQSISSADRFTTENHRQSQFISASGIGEDNSRSRTPTSKSVTPHKCRPSWRCVLMDTRLCVPQRSRSSACSQRC